MCIVICVVFEVTFLIRDPLGMIILVSWDGLSSSPFCADTSVFVAKSLDFSANPIISAPKPINNTTPITITIENKVLFVGIILRAIFRL